MDDSAVNFSAKQSEKLTGPNANQFYYLILFNDSLKKWYHEMQISL
jgi:hypothetical protein